MSKEKILADMEKEVTLDEIIDITTGKRVKEVFLEVKNNSTSMRKAMDKAGYSKNVSSKSVMKTKTWGALIKHYFPPEALAEVHASLLNSDDKRVKLKALELMYSLSGVAEKTVNVNIRKESELSMKSDSELEDMIDGEFEILEDNPS